MKYTIRVWASGNYPELSIDEARFNNLKQARLCLSAALAIEEKYELLISNYLDLEKECLNVTSISMIRSSTDYSGFFDIRLAFNRRVVNLLTSTKLYIDQIQQHVKSCFPDRSDIGDNVKALFSAEYGKFFEYRFMEALRNYVQHRGLAVHSTSLGSKWTSQEGDAELEFKTRLFTHKTEVDGDKAFKKQVSKEMAEKVDLLYAVRVYVGSISKIHCEIRELVAPTSEDSRHQILEAINEYEAINGKKPLGLNAISSIPKEPIDEMIEKFPLLLEWDDIRLDLIKKNKSLANLSKRYVSNSVHHKEFRR